MASNQLVYQTYSPSRTLLMRMWERVGHQSARPAATAKSSLSTFTKHWSEGQWWRCTVQQKRLKKGHWKSRVLSQWTSASAAIIKHNQLFRHSRPISVADGGCPVSEIYNVNSFKTRLWNRLPAAWKWGTSPGQSRVPGKPSIWILLQSNELIKASSEGMSSQMLRPSRISYSLTWRDERRGNFFLLVRSIINRVDIKWATKHNI